MECRLTHHGVGRHGVEGHGKVGDTPVDHHDNWTVLPLDQDGGLLWLRCYNRGCSNYWGVPRHVDASTSWKTGVSCEGEG